MSGLRTRVADRSVTVMQGGSGPAVFPISCDATQAQAAAVVRQVNHITPATQPQVALVVRAVSHICVTTQPQLVKALRTLSVTCAATQAQSAAVARTVNHTCTATQGQVVTCTVYFVQAAGPGGGGDWIKFPRPEYPRSRKDFFQPSRGSR